MARIHDEKVTLKIYWRGRNEIILKDETDWWDEKIKEVKSLRNFKGGKYWTLKGI